MSEWQPIETAPKDGTEILLYGKPKDVLCNCAGVRFKEPFVFSGSWSELDKSFWMSGATWLGPFVDAPTYWMPLPEPPK